MIATSFEMTSLQQQLAAIAAKSTHQLDLKAQRLAHGKSLLFDTRTAVSQDFDTLYQICIEGFEELCHLDERFMTYGMSIFSEQSKAEDRGQMTKSENEKLDSVLCDFFILVSSRLLLKPAQKSVEWLVRRFRVHEYNLEPLLLAFLPYHSTPMFMKLLGLLPDRLPSSFKFLKPYINAGSNPPTHVIIYSATNNSSFFSAFNKFMVNIFTMNAHSSSLISFWTSISAPAGS